jgi:tRNA G10  N-methylase Trm11
MSLFNYIAILGRQPELGLVELESLLGADKVRPFGRSAALLAAAPDLSRLGGVVKLGRIISDVYLDDVSCMIHEIEVWEAVESLVRERSGKVPFGISVYGGKYSAGEVARASYEYKRQLGEKAESSLRAVVPSGRSTELNAAQLKSNKILERGFELMVVCSGKDAFAAFTTAVQDVDWYSKRDYDRPKRSAKVGMLPPKLAQVMVNTTSTSMVVDPFCGMGAVLQEALLDGREAAGSDSSADMVHASRSNLVWLAGQIAAPLPDWRVEQADAREVTLPKGCSVVTEGYLGTPLAHSPVPAQLKSLRAGLKPLYRRALAHWARKLPAGAEVTITVPAWRVQGKWQYLGLVDELPALGYTSKSFQHVRTPLLYARPDQVVGRQLLMLRKN